MKSPVARRARNSNAQCCHHTATGRRCRATRSSSESCLCPRHRATEQKLLSAESADITPEFTDLEESLQTVEGIHTSLSELYILVAQDRISPRRAAVLAYVSSLLLRSLATIEKNAAKSKPRERIIYNWAPREDSAHSKTAAPAQQTATGPNPANAKHAANTAARENVPRPADIANGTASPSAANTINGASAASARNVPTAVNLANSPSAPSINNGSVAASVKTPAAPRVTNLFDTSNGIHLGDYANSHDGSIGPRCPLQPTRVNLHGQT